MSKILVVIVAYYSDDDLKRCLPTLNCSEALEVVVVDNASQVATRQLLAECFPRVRYCDPGSNLGFARANNLGAQGFEGNAICFLNPDTEVDPGALERLAEWLDASPRCGAVGPYVRNTDGSRQMSFRRWPGFTTALFHRYSLITRLLPGNPWSQQYLMSDDDGQTARQVDWLSGCCLMVRRSAFVESGRFDERYFMFCEDTALGKAMSLAGWERWYRPEASITHHIGKSLGEKSVALVFQRHRSMWLYFSTFSLHPVLLAPFTLAGLLVRFTIYALRACLSGLR